MTSTRTVDAIQLARAERFRALHAGPQAFVIPNPWDAGSARMLALMGFEALATSSAGFSFSIARPDTQGEVSRAESLANAKAIVDAGNLPVSADLENGFGDSPEDCAETIRQAAAVGLVGGSIEDATGDASNPIYEAAHALARVKAAVAAARALPFPFTLTARAENFLHGRSDLADTIRRLQSFADAGADVLFAPGLQTREQIAAVVQAVAPKPINVLIGLAATLNLQQLSDLGVKRVSVGSAFARVAYGAMLRAAGEVRDAGTFGFVKDAAPFGEMNAMFQP